MRDVARIGSVIAWVSGAALMLSVEAYAGNSGGDGHRRRTGPLGIEFVWVGAPGNKPDVPDGLDRRFGAVSYGYWISATEITCAQYAAFLNSIATQGDPHGLWVPADGQRWPQDIVRRVNKDGTYRYEVVNGYVDHPVVRMDHRKIFRFMNWLHNGMQDNPKTTEHGAYDASSWGHYDDGRYTDSMDHLPDARYWLPSEDEWYKAAYFDPDRFGEGQPGYWNYATRHDTVPDIWDIEGADPFNSAIYATPDSWPVVTIPTTVSPWGAYDMAGSASEYVAEWYLEEWRYGEAYVVRGGDWVSHGSQDHGFDRGYVQAPLGTPDWDLTSFRIVTTIPTPGSGLVLLAACARWRRRDALHVCRRDCVGSPIVARGSHDGPNYGEP
jgi:sulfatase modifying factor 1